MRASSGVFAAALFVASTNLSDAATLSPKEIHRGSDGVQPMAALQKKRSLAFAKNHYNALADLINSGHGGFVS